MERSKIFIGFIEVIKHTEKEPRGFSLFIKIEDIDSFEKNETKKIHVKHPIWDDDSYYKDKKELFDAKILFKGTYEGQNSAYVKLPDDYLTTIVATVNGSSWYYFSKLSPEDFRYACQFPEGMDKYLRDIFHPEKADRFDLMDL